MPSKRLRGIGWVNTTPLDEEQHEQAATVLAAVRMSFRMDR